MTMSAVSLQTCIEELERLGKPTFPNPTGSLLYCNATWDSVLCWPATPAGTYATLPCPPLKGLDPTKNVKKFCHSSGYWAGKIKNDFSNPTGWTDFSTCFESQLTVAKEAQAIARGVRKLELVGLVLSLCSLIIAIAIFCSFRKLRVFRNQIHIQLMLALFMVVLIRLTLYISIHLDGTINNTPILCESFYFLLEYFKTVAFMWMFIEGVYLLNTVVTKMRPCQPKIWWLLIIGYGIPLLNASIWIIGVVSAVQGRVKICLGYYYINSLFWLLDGPRRISLLITFILLLVAVIVAVMKQRGRRSTTMESHCLKPQQLRNRALGAVVLIFLLGIPNVLQSIPVTPTQQNMYRFRIYTYIASVFYMFQGLMVAAICCLTNPEVIIVLKCRWQTSRANQSSTPQLGDNPVQLLPAPTTLHDTPRKQDYGETCPMLHQQENQ